MREYSLPFDSRFDRLAVFSFAWAVANVLHALSFTDRISLQHPFAIGVLLAAAFVILIPWSVWPLLLMLSCSVANTFEWMPYAPNHITFEFIINSGILTTLVWLIARLYLKDKTIAAVATPDFRNTLFQTFAPFIRISLFILYFYAVFHKLNWDYFNPTISCSVFLLSGYANRFPFIPDNALVQWSAIWGTIVIEAAIPLLLYFRRTRSTGVFLGCGFHYFLALHPHPGLYSFSSMLFAIYFLFLSDVFTPTVHEFADSRIYKKRQYLLTLFRILLFAAVIVVIVLALIAGAYINNIVHKLTLFGFLIWLVWGLVLIGFYIYSVSYSVYLESSSATLFHMKKAMLWLVPLLVLFNGLTPYLGIKTQTNFSMFSNLRTEGNISNHIFVSPSLQLFDMEKDLVEVTKTNLQDLQNLVNNNQVIPYFEFKRITSNAHIDFYATYIHNNETQTIVVKQGISNQPELLIPHNWLAAKFIRFRPVDKGPCLCKH
ncbi:HTTM domain-containing protein [Hymenobacter volaticus]|uniref:HTTM domain-containing protein n=1 Tax=Hymenobacter volaticus TaxID=2932254 RepID=A0ABY4G6M9_9BACT|nr:HTTM domain-containing protein [Hymenobacter volaticus]UOQ66497.1 HTTM domain-containing protein [Hymenobacter volaticus]